MAHHKQLELDFLEELDYSDYDMDVQFEFEGFSAESPVLTLEEFESNFITFDKYGVEMDTTLNWEVETPSDSKVSMLENEVFTLQGQLQTAYKRINELTQELETFKAMVKPNSRNF